MSDPAPEQTSPEGVRVVYVRPDGSRGEHSGRPGASVMSVAASSGEDGIVAECGGSLMCATCHVYVDPSGLALLDPPQEDEEAMLECTASPRLENSRLSCQIILTPALDGLVVTLPEDQL